MPRGGQVLSFHQSNFNLGDRVFVYGIVKGLDVERCEASSLEIGEQNNQVISGYELMLDHWCWGTKSYRPDLELRRKQLPPVVLPTANARVFAISNALDIEQDPGKYKCQLYLPLTLPPTVRRKNFSYDYILAIANKQPDSKRRDDSKKTPGEATNLELNGRPLTTNSPSRSFGEDSMPEDNFSGSKQCALTLKVEPSLALFAPLTEWIPTFVKYRDLSKALLPPPPIFPPLPSRPGTPSSLALSWDLGACYTSGVPVSLPMVGWKVGDIEPIHEFRMNKEKADIGMGFLRWLCFISLDLSTPISSEPKLADHMTPSGVKPTILQHYLRDSDASISSLRQTINRRAPKRHVNEKAVSLTGSLSKGFNTKKLVSVLSWTNLVRGKQFVSSFEAGGEFRPRITRVYRISVDGCHLGSLQLSGVSPCEPIRDLPKVKDYQSESRRLIDPEREPMWLETSVGDTLFVHLDLSESTLAVVELSVRLVRYTRIYQPPLTPPEALAWIRRRNALVRTAPGGERRNPPGLSWLDFRSFDHMAAVDTTLTLQSTTTETVAEVHACVNQTCLAVTPLTIPSHLEPSFRHDRVGVSYEIQVDFTCLARHGVVLDLASRCENGHVPLVTINGPLPPRYMNKVTWCNTVVLKTLEPLESSSAFEK